MYCLFRITAFITMLFLVLSCIDDSSEGGIKVVNQEKYITFSLNAGPQVRAGEDVNALPEEVKINTIDIFVSNTKGMARHTFTTTSGNYSEMAPGVYSPGMEAVIAIPADMVSVFYLFVNLTDAQLTEIRKTNFNAFSSPFSIPNVDFLKPAAEGFLMTGTAAYTVAIDEGYETKEDALANSINIQVERALAKVAITAINPSIYTLANGLGTVSNVEFTLKNINTKLYPSAQGRTDDRIDPNFGRITGVPVGEYFFPNATDVYSPGLVFTPVPDHNPANYAIEQVQYATENTNQMNYQVGNTTYALIRAKFTPSPDRGTAAADGTFFYGDADNRCYATIEDAIDAGNRPLASRIEFGTVKYDQGFCYYAVPIGQLDPTLRRAPVVRNNYYYLIINSVFNLGLPTDPLSEPYQIATNDIPYGVTLSTTLTVEKWTLINREYVL